MLVMKILENSWQNQPFDLSLLTKQEITSHVIAIEESYQELFISQPSVTSNQKIFEEYTISQLRFAKFLFVTGMYHLSEIIYQRFLVQEQKILGLEYSDTLLISMGNLASTFCNQGR